MSKVQSEPFLTNARGELVIPNYSSDGQVKIPGSIIWDRRKNEMYVSDGVNWVTILTAGSSIIVDNIICNNLDVQENGLIQGDLTVDGTINGVVVPSGFTLTAVDPLSPGVSLIVNDTAPNFTLKKIESTTGDITISGANPDYIDISLAASGVVADDYPDLLDGTRIPRFTVDASGKITFADSISVAPPSGIPIVGPTGEYVNVGAAVAAGVYCMRLQERVITVETANINLLPITDSNPYFCLEIPEGATWNLNTYNMIVAEDNRMIIKIIGHEKEYSTILYNQSVQPLITYSALPSTRLNFLYVENVFIDNDNPSSTQPFADYFKQIYRNCKFSTNDNNSCIKCGFAASAPNEIDLIMNDCVIEVSSTVGNFINQQGLGQTRIDGLIIIGNATSTNGFNMTGYSIFNNIQVISTGVNNITLKLPQITTNFQSISLSAGGALVQFNSGLDPTGIRIFANAYIENTSVTFASNMMISNMIMVDGTSTGVCQNAQFTNCSFNANTTFNINPVGCTFNNCRWNGSLTLSNAGASLGDNAFIGCRIFGQVSITGNNNIMNGCVVGDIITKGGAETITLSGDYNIITSCMTDVAIVPGAGANNQIANNVVF